MHCITTTIFGQIYGAFCSVYFLSLLSLFILSSAGSANAEDSQSRLIAEAAASSLSSARDWDVLLHYRPHGKERESLVDDPRFFLSSEGKTDPSAELDATIKGFFADSSMGDDHPRCRFPARYEWLKSALDFDTSKFPQPVCAKLDESLAAVDPRTVVLVFPSAHNNGPASMFGHTLLRVGSSYKSDLLSYAVNYAAHTTETNGLVYAFKGIFGSYPGYYSILPYYEKVKEYNDLEHRDVWEYPLSLSPEEARRMVLHIWELQGIYSDYYFFDENCSFMLLSLLEAARPSLRLTEEYWSRTSFWVIPSDTIGSIRNSGLIEKVTYRPAQATRISYRSALLNPDARERAHAIARGSSPDSAENKDRHSREEGRQVLDLAAEYLQYLYSRKEVEQGQFQGRFLQILRQRSTLGPGEIDAGKVPDPPQPEEGHKSIKITAGAGVRDDRPFTEFSWRPAYHDLLDPEAGYTKGAQINFMSVVGRYFPEDNSLILQSVRPVDIVSLAPRDLFFQPISWKVNGGVDREIFRDGSDKLILRLNTGGGLAWELSGIGTFYSFAEVEFKGSDRFREKIAFGAGVSAGLQGKFTDVWSYHLEGRALGFAIENHQKYSAGLDQQFSLSKNSGIKLKLLWERSFDYDKGEAMGSLVWYF